MKEKNKKKTSQIMWSVLSTLCGIHMHDNGIIW